MVLTIEKKKELFKEFGGLETNTGSAEAQVAILSHDIDHLSEHLRTHRKDHSTTRSLLKKVGKRKRLLKYLAHKDITKYRSLIEKLKLRK